MIHLDEDSAWEEVDLAVIGSQKTTLPFADFLSEVTQIGQYESGILPPGTISIRRAGKRSQYVVQTPPGLYNAGFSNGEGGPLRVRRIAMPYRVIISEFDGDFLVGARMFYAIKRIDSSDDLLYHTNLPNINCLGYSHSVAVGWVCLYLNDRTPRKTDAERIAYVGLRCSGNETYNNNMTSTDGRAIYRTRKPDHPFLWDYDKLEQKSDTEGWSWVLDESLWVPVKVSSLSTQTCHSDNGKPLTFGAAIHGHPKYYYHDDPKKSLFNTRANSKALYKIIRDSLRTNHKSLTKYTKVKLATNKEAGNHATTPAKES